MVPFQIYLHQFLIIRIYLMSIFLPFDPEATLTSRLFTATFLHIHLFPVHKALGSRSPYCKAADSHSDLPAHKAAGTGETAALAAAEDLASEVSAAFPFSPPPVPG